MHVHIDVGNILPNERTLSHQILIQSGPSDSLDTWQHVPQSLPYLPLFLPLLFLFISLPSSFPCFFFRGSPPIPATRFRSTESYFSEVLGEAPAAVVWGILARKSIWKKTREKVYTMYTL